MEARIERVHLDESILRGGNPDRVDSDAWRPLMMSFGQFYGLAEGTVHVPELAKIPQRLYPRPGPDARHDRAGSVRAGA